MKDICTTNYDCIESSYCCTNFSCGDPGYCLNGRKVKGDICDFNFECLSRCCGQGVCSHFMSCYQKCGNNVECNSLHDQEGCCSDNFCTASIVCSGNKIVGDYCDNSTECLSQACLENKCQMLTANKMT